MTAPAFPSVDAALRHWAAVDPEAQAVLGPGLSPLSCGDLWRVCRQVAAALAAAGAGVGSRVALFIPQSRDAEVLDTAVSTCAVPVPLNPALPVAALRELGALLQPALAIAVPETAAAAASLGCPVLLLDPALLVPGAAPAVEPAPRRPDDHAIILATSGSTGEPRLIPRTHAQLAVSTAAWVERLGFARDNVGFIAAPPYHAMGAALFRSLLAGAPAIVHPAAPPAATIAAIRAVPPTWILGGPSWFAGLLSADDAPLPRLRLVMSGSAPMPPALAAAIRRRFDAPIVFDYGLSEAPCLALTMAGDDPAADPRYLPLLPDTVRIASPDTAPLPPGKEGEIVIRGPIVFPGSIGSTASAIATEFDAAGWYRTGDLGILDPDGRFRVTGRLKHLVNRGGEMISPLEIERALLGHPAVADAAVIGVPHPALGEDLLAVVVARPGLAVATRELRRWLLDRLPPTRVPRSFEFRDRLPLNAAGKTDRRALAAEQLGRARD